MEIRRDLSNLREEPTWTGASAIELHENADEDDKHKKPSSYSPLLLIFSLNALLSCLYSQIQLCVSTLLDMTGRLHHSLRAAAIKTVKVGGHVILVVILALSKYTLYTGI